jgi:hypothetical protein
LKLDTGCFGVNAEPEKRSVERLLGCRRKGTKEFFGAA